MKKRKYTESEINEIISRQKDMIAFDDNKISDGYHTFGELYEFRKLYNAVLFNDWARQYEPLSPDECKKMDLPVGSYMVKHSVYKSWKHHDGEWCFGEKKKWFIVSAKLPTGLISNHYKAEDWDLFQIPEAEKSYFKFDGHTGADVLVRMKELIKKYQTRPKYVK